MRWEVVVDPTAAAVGDYVRLNCSVVSMPDHDNHSSVLLGVGAYMRIAGIDYGAQYPDPALYTVDYNWYQPGIGSRVERYTISARCFDVLGPYPF